MILDQFSTSFLMEQRDFQKTQPFLSYYEKRHKIVTLDLKKAFFMNKKSELHASL